MRTLKTKERMNEAAKLFSEGKNIDEISVILERSKETIKNYLINFANREAEKVFHQYKRDHRRKPYLAEVDDLLEKNIDKNLIQFTSFYRWKRWTYEADIAERKSHEERVFKMMEEIIGKKVLLAILESLDLTIEKIKEKPE